MQMAVVGVSSKVLYQDFSGGHKNHKNYAIIVKIGTWDI
jgi:hypothetical protein